MYFNLLTLSLIFLELNEFNFMLKYDTDLKL